MASVQISIRLEPDIVADLKDEAKKRGQDMAALARTFIRDGLARYDAVGEKLLQTDERIERRLDAIESLVAANLHVMVDQQTRVNRQETDEAHSDYANRLKAIYKESLDKALEKGNRIIAVLFKSKP